MFEDPEIPFRKLATIRKVLALDPIEGADKIIRATVDGWHLVTGKTNGFEVGDLCLYCEIDSFLPTSHPYFSFLAKTDGSGVVFNGVAGHRLRTIRLRGQVSQGLIVPIKEKSFFGSKYVVKDINGGEKHVSEGDDVTEFLGIQKYEKPLPSQLVGTVRRTMPSFLHKSDQERVQNLRNDLAAWATAGDTFEVTYKLDGSSMTVYKNQEDFGVCSRNMDLKETAENAFWQSAKKEGLLAAVQASDRNIALQGELYGPGIQGNPEGLAEVGFYLFDIWDIDTASYFLPAERKRVLEAISTTTGIVINEIPFHSFDSISDLDSIDSLLAKAQGPGFFNTAVEREGLVYKSTTVRGRSFKVISNNFLLGEK